MNNSGQYFSIKTDNGSGPQLYFLEQRLAKSTFLEEAQGVLTSHRIPSRTRYNLYASLIFCLASHSLVYERALKLMEELGKADPHLIEDGDAVFARASKRKMRFPENRFSPALDYARKRPGGIEQLASDFLDQPHATREELRENAKWMGLKTASFWYLCLGGRDLMTLDVHNLRQLGAIPGVSVSPDYYIAKPRQSGKTQGMFVTSSPSPREYLRIEQEALQAVGIFPEFQTEGKVQADLITTVFWWAGVRGARGVVRQMDLPNVPRTFFRSPYNSTHHRDQQLELELE